MIGRHNTRILRKMQGVCALAAVAVAALSAAALEAPVRVSIDADFKYQTILGWGAASWRPPWATQALRDQILDEAVKELGLTRLRLEGPSGNRSDDRRWEWLNDNGDPDDINWDGFNTAKLDEKVSEWVAPFKERVEANGEPFDLYVSPSFFDGGSSGSVPAWLLYSPGEYAEYAAAFLLHLENRHNLIANYYCICNEAGNNNPFTPSVIGTMIKALGRRLEALGLPTKIEFPECISANASWNYLQALQNDADVWRHVGVITYHLYGTNDPYRSYVRDFAVSRGLPTGQTEYMGLTINHLYDDLTLGGVSYWELYGQWISPNYDRTSFSRGEEHWNFRQVLHYVRPGAERVKTTSDNPALRPLAFVRDGKMTVVLLNNTAPQQARTATVIGLPPGAYGVCQCVGGAPYQELGLKTVEGKSDLTVNVPANAVLTLYPYPGTNLPPTMTDWTANPSYLIAPASSTTLSASATDAELDAISYGWSVTSQPAGASATLGAPNANRTSATGLTAAGDYVFRVEVSDGTNTTTRDVMLIVHGENQAPVPGDVHNRLPVMVTLPTSSTSLRAYAWDLEGDSLSYRWSVISQPAGAKVSLANPTATNCSASSMTVAGDYVFRFEVRDPTHTVSEDLRVTVYPLNTPPFIKGASASPAGLTLPDSSRTLLSATSGDREGDVISHWWSVKSAPQGVRPLFLKQGSAQTEVGGLTRPGAYVFTLTIVDQGGYATRDVTVNVEGASATPAVTTLEIGMDNAVTLAWTDFAPMYTVEAATDLVQPHWEAVSPVEQWPAWASSWTGDDIASKRIVYYRIRGE